MPDAMTKANSGATLTELRERFRTVSVTGSNGKTTTTSGVEAMLAAGGATTARITTLGAWVNGEQVAEDATSEAFAATIHRAAAAGVTALAIETTSHALAQGFASGWPADVAIFTNLSRDHLDYHGTPEHYLAAKAQLFVHLPTHGTAVLNACDPSSELFDEVTPPGVRRLWYTGRPGEERASRGASPDLAAVHVEVSRTGTLVRLAPSPLATALGGRLELPLIGRVHVDNALAAALGAWALGVTPDAIRTALTTFAGVPGRFQIVHDHPLVVVDFAHTPDALARTLRLAAELVAPAGRVVCVFGCGGERDAGKRPEMGRIATEQAAHVVLTTDNPRHEDPAAIADAVMSGATGPGRLEQVIDRAEAIRRGIELAGPYDSVVIAGKGHERIQQVGDQTLPFDDVDVARAHCAALSKGEQ